MHFYPLPPHTEVQLSASRSFAASPLSTALAYALRHPHNGRWGGSDHVARRAVCVFSSHTAARLPSRANHTPTGRLLVLRDLAPRGRRPQGRTRVWAARRHAMPYGARRRNRAHATSVGVPSTQVRRESTTHMHPAHVRPERTPASHTGELRVAHVFTCTAYGNVCSKTRWFHVDHCDVPPDGWCRVQGYDLLEPTARRCAAPETRMCDPPRPAPYVRLWGAAGSSRDTRDPHPARQRRRPRDQPVAHDDARPPTRPSTPSARRPRCSALRTPADSLSMPTLRRSAPPSFGSTTRRAVQ